MTFKKNIECIAFIHFNARSLYSTGIMSGIRKSLNRHFLISDKLAISKIWTNEYYLHYDLPNYTRHYVDRTTKQCGGLYLHEYNISICRAVK